MKKNKVTNILLIIFAIILFAFPNYSNATTEKIGYTSIEETTTLNISSLYFSEIKYKENENTSNNFGLIGFVENNSNLEENFIAQADFFDKDYNLIATLESKQSVKANQNNYFSNYGDIRKIKEGFTKNDIKYYTLTVTTNKTAIDNSSEDKFNYIINDYKINMNVNEDNTFDITETIKVNFNKSSHGIIRKIPFKNNISRLDGSKSKNRAEITNIKVNEEHEISNRNDYKVIKIGNANKTVNGSHTYIIKYKYNIGKDPLKNADELYFNLIGSEWDTIIKKSSFEINMPKDFDKNLLGFSYGNIGSTNNENINYTVDENKIIGSLNEKLEPGQALTIRLDLPDKYFIGAGQKIDMYSLCVISLCLLFVLIAYNIWKKYGKDDEIIETVEFYPPENYNSAEVGIIYEGKVSKKSIISLLIYLANKGYIKIEEIKEKILVNDSKGFKITKLKDYDGNNKYEKDFLEGLFKSKNKETVNIKKARQIMEDSKKYGKQINYKEALELSKEKGDDIVSVTDSDLYDNFYETVDDIEYKMNNSINKVIESSSKRKCKWLILMCIIIFILIISKPILEYTDEGLLMIPIITMFYGTGLIIMLSNLILKTKKSDNKISDIFNKIYNSLFGLLFAGFPFVGYILPTLLESKYYLLMHILGLISIIIILIFVRIMPKRTEESSEIYGKIKGFKKFLETAEKPQLESLVMKNPEYFYDILPYTYVLGVSDKWIKQFETIALKSPNWYESSNDFNINSFGTFINYTMNNISIEPYSTSKGSGSSFGGSSSGGGCSGGGSGGGGGSSW